MGMSRTCRYDLIGAIPIQSIGLEQFLPFRLQLLVMFKNTCRDAEMID